MRYTNLGDTGLKVSRICLGTMTFGTSEWRDWVLDEEESRPYIERALDLGINFFDTADMYSQGVSEEVVGRALGDYADREEYVLASKAYFPTGNSPNERGLSRKHLMHAVDASLERLGTDYIDLYYIHRWDYDTPIEETMETLHRLVETERVRYIGASSMFAWQLAKANHLAAMNGWSKFVAMQNHYNLIYREEEREMMPYCREHGIGVCPWSPLARGFLAGNRDRHGGGATKRAQNDDFADSMYFRDADFAVLDRLEEVTAERDDSAAQIALAWLLHKPGVTSPIVGTTKHAHLEEACEAVEIELSDEAIERLESAYVPHPVLGHTTYDEAIGE